jgi:hypothetical protein
MRNSIIFAGVAALALAGPALAQGKGQGGPKGGGGPAKVERGGGPQKAGRMPGGNGGGPREVRVERRQEVARDARGGQSEVRGQRGRGAEKATGNGRGAAREEVRQDRRLEARGRSAGRMDAERRNGRDAREVRDIREVREERLVRDTGRFDRGSDRTLALLRSPTVRTTGLIEGCPPGLWAKNNGCLPPGQARKLVGQAVPAALGAALLPQAYRSWYPDDEEYFYRLDDGYVYRIDRDRNLVDGFFPLVTDWTGAYYVGAAYPQDYLGYYNVPVQYRPWYSDGDDYYRYADGAIYRVDRQQGLIESIVSLLAGDLAIGQRLPAGYDMYNVPIDYRDRYVDGPDAWYRYNDGYIYQVDPTTRLVQAIVETLI